MPNTYYPSFDDLGWISAYMRERGAIAELLAAKLDAPEDRVEAILRRYEAEAIDEAKLEVLPALERKQYDALGPREQAWAALEVASGMCSGFLCPTVPRRNDALGRFLEDAYSKGDVEDWAQALAILGGEGFGWLRAQLPLPKPSAVARVKDVPPPAWFEDQVADRAFERGDAGAKEPAPLGEVASAGSIRRKRRQRKSDPPLICISPSAYKSRPLFESSLQAWARKHQLQYLDDGECVWVHARWARYARESFVDQVFPGLIGRLSFDKRLERFTVRSPGQVWADGDWVYVEPMRGSRGYASAADQLDALTEKSISVKRSRGRARAKGHKYDGVWRVPATLLAEVLSGVAAGFERDAYTELLGAERRERRLTGRQLDALETQFADLLPKAIDIMADAPAKKKPKSCQREAIEWMLKKRNVILAHDMGLGKTLDAAMVALAAQRVYPGLRVYVVAPKVLKRSWERTLDEVGVSNYEIGSWHYMTAPKPPADTPYIVIADEAHRAQNLRAAKTQRFMDLSKGWRYRITAAGLAKTPELDGAIVEFLPDTGKARRLAAEGESVGMINWVMTADNLILSGHKADLDKVTKAYVHKLLAENGQDGLPLFDLAFRVGAVQPGEHSNVTASSPDAAKAFGLVGKNPESEPSLNRYLSRSLKAALKSLEAEGLVESASRAPLALILATGTPMNNGTPDNLFSLLYALGHPLADNKREFDRRFYVQTVGKDGKERPDKSRPANLDELYEATKDIIQFRTKAECLPDLPPKIRLLKEIQPTAAQSKAYKDLVDAAKADVKNGNQLSRNSLKRLNAARISAAMAKTGMALELAEELVERGEKVVVFTSFRDPGRLLARQLTARGISTLFVDGETKNPQDLVDQFQSDPSSKVIILTYQTGGLGITLTAATQMILLDRPWTPGDVRQAEDRIHRIGQNRQVTIYWLQAFEIDKRVDRLIMEKIETIERTLAGGRIGMLTFDEKSSGSFKEVMDEVRLAVLGKF